MAVGRDIAAGGDALVNGDLTVRRNVRIEGWLDAPNLLTPCRGLFATVDELERHSRHPRTGEWALVGDTLPADLYVASGRKWQNTGRQAGLTAPDSDRLSAMIEEAKAIAASATEAARKASEAAAEATAASDALAELLIDGDLDRIKERMDQTETELGRVRRKQENCGIVPFDGIVPSRGGAARPQSGVWFETGNASQPGHFLFISSETGLSEEDYNDRDSGQTGTAPARSDRLFRLDNRLYVYDEEELTLLPFAIESV